jgi:hypothetical protein
VYPFFNNIDMTTRVVDQSLKTSVICEATILVMKSIAELKARRMMDRANEGEPINNTADDRQVFERVSKEDDLD